MKTTALVPYFGAARMQAERIAEHLNGAAWLGIPFAGGMSELAHVTCRTIVVNDLHKHVINLARVIADAKLVTLLAGRLEHVPFHPDALAEAQAKCLRSLLTREPDLEAAESYFISQWMGRSGQAGTDSEFKGKLPVRWTSSGGDSNTRYRSAVASLAEWGEIMRRCNFTCLDAFEFLSNVRDETGHAVLCDPPWPDLGDGYRNKFMEADHRQLAEVLANFVRTKVVVRINDHPLVRELYPESEWNWTRYESRNSGNAAVAEVLIVRG